MGLIDFGKGTRSASRCRQPSGYRRYRRRPDPLAGRRTRNRQAARANPEPVCPHHIERPPPGSGFDLVATRLARDDQPDAGRSRVAERHRWSRRRFHEPVLRERSQHQQSRVTVQECTSRTLQKEVGEMVEPAEPIDRDVEGASVETEWFSTWQTNDPVHDNKWATEIIKISRKQDSNFFTFESSRNSLEYEWEGIGEVHRNYYISGTWESKNGNPSAGSFMLHAADSQSRMRTGFLLGPTEG